MNDTQKYGLPNSNSEVWLSQSAGFTYRADIQRHEVQRHEVQRHEVQRQNPKPCTNRSVQKIQSSYHPEQAIEIEAIEVEASHLEVMQPIEMQRLAHEVQPVQASPAESSPDQDPNPGLLDIGFWLNLPE